MWPDSKRLKDQIAPTLAARKNWIECGLGVSNPSKRNLTIGGRV